MEDYFSFHTNGFPSVAFQVSIISRTSNTSLAGGNWSKLLFFKEHSLLLLSDIYIYIYIYTFPQENTYYSSTQLCLVHHLNTKLRSCLREPLKLVHSWCIFYSLNRVLNFCQHHVHQKLRGNMLSFFTLSLQFF